MNQVNADEQIKTLETALREAEQRAEKWFAKACEDHAMRMVAEATVTALRCDCGASESGTKWGGIHTPDCAAIAQAEAAALSPPADNHLRYAVQDAINLLAGCTHGNPVGTPNERAHRLLEAALVAYPPASPPADMEQAPLLTRAIEMRRAIDALEGALMGYGDLVDLPQVFRGVGEAVMLAPKVTVGQMRQVCEALAECTRIINSEEYTERALTASPHAVEREWQPIQTAPKDGRRILAWHPAWSAPLTVQFYGEWWGIEYSLPRLLNQPTHWQPLPAPPHRAGDDSGNREQ